MGRVGRVEGDLEATAELLGDLDDGTELVVGVPLLGKGHACKQRGSVSRCESVNKACLILKFRIIKTDLIHRISE